MGSLKFNRERTDRCDVNTFACVDTFNKCIILYIVAMKTFLNNSDMPLASATKAYGYCNTDPSNGFYVLWIPVSSHHYTMRRVSICVQYFHVSVRTDFKILLITNRAMRGLAPSDLTDILLPYVPSCYLRYLRCIIPNFSGLE